VRSLVRGLRPAEVSKQAGVTKPSSITRPTMLGGPVEGGWGRTARHSSRHTPRYRDGRGTSGYFSGEGASELCSQLGKQRLVASHTHNVGAFFYERDGDPRPARK
jgi:hypothetical protein